MNTKIESKIAEIVSALGAEPAKGENGAIPGDFIANKVQYSFNVVKLTTVYPSLEESGLLLSIVIDGEKIVECGFYLSTKDIVKLLKK